MGQASKPVREGARLVFDGLDREDLAALERIAGHVVEQIEKADLRTSVGYVVPGVDFRVMSAETDEPVPWDGTQTGELQVAARQVQRAVAPLRFVGGGDALQAGVTEASLVDVMTRVAAPRR